MDDWIRTQVGERELKKTSWVAPRDFFVPQNFRLGETQVEGGNQKDLEDPAVDSTAFLVKNFVDPDELFNKRYPELSFAK
jgi:hypothetical protein